MDDKITTILQIGGVGVPVVFNRKDEEIARKAATQVTEQVTRLMQTYRVESKEKALAMAAYQFAVQQLRLEQLNATQPYTEKIEELTQLLEAYFKAP